MLCVTISFLVIERQVKNADVGDQIDQTAASDPNEKREVVKSVMVTLLQGHILECVMHVQNCCLCASLS